MLRKTFLSCILLLFTVSIQAQNQKIILNSSVTSIKEVFASVEKQTKFSINYNQTKFDVNKNIKISTTNATLEKVLTQALEGTQYTFSIHNNNILIIPISRKSNESNESPEKHNISGLVQNINGESLIGVSITLIGDKSRGTITDFNGNFRLSNVSLNAKITVSYIGYTKLILIGKRNMKIIMKEDSKLLDEIVVVGYGTQKKVNLTGAISSVKTDEINSVPTSNLSNSLAGRAAGVTITTTSGLAGSSSRIRMRGSFGEPLFVINNIIKSKADFDALDPNEVENISFLKDAASASIYGSKAGNGVILVTTKKGKDQRPKFHYKGIFSVSKTASSLQDYSATDELIFANRLAETLGRTAPYGKEMFDYFSDKSYNVNDYVWRNPSSQQHDLSVNGGNERITYYMMLGFHDEKGSYQNLNFKKYNFRSNVTANITKRFKVNFDLSGNQRNYRRFYWPYDSVNNFNVPDFYRTTFNWTRLYPFYVDEKGNPTTDTSAYPVTAGPWNPVEMVIGNRYQKIVEKTIDGQLRFDLDLGQYIDGLKTSFLGHYTSYSKDYKGLLTHNKSYRFKSASPENKYLPGPINPNDMVIHNLSSSYEGIREGVNLDHSYQINWFLNYDKKFGKHSISGLLVYEQSEATGKYMGGSADDMLTTSIDQIFVTSKDTERRYFNGSEWENARQSIVGRFNYTYADKYIAEFSFREDGNYKFASESRWGFFPSGSAAWRISEEDFMENIDCLSNLKIRGSYGSTGDDGGVSAFQWRNYYKNGGGFMFGDSYNNGLKIGNTPNPYITWAKLEVYDIGLDFGFFNNRLSGELDYFHKTKSDILRSRNNVVPGTYGASLPSENYAEQKWDGFEASLKWSDNVRDLSYDVYANMGYVKDKWTVLDEAEGLESWRSAIGHPNNRIMGYLSEGMIRTQDQLDALGDDFTQFGRKPMLGTLLFKDIRGMDYSEGPDGKIDGNDYTYLSDKATPRINYGFGFNLAWKGITLNAHFQGVGMYDRMVSTMNGGGVFQVGDRPYFELWTKDVWTPENTNAKYPRIGGKWTAPEFGGSSSSFWLRNGAYLRLKNLNIGYDLPKQWFSNIGIEKVKLFVNGTNLFCISSMNEMDPEQNTLDSYPIMRTFTGGLSINF